LKPGKEDAETTPTCIAVEGFAPRDDAKYTTAGALKKALTP